MLISKNSGVEAQEFERLLSRTTASLQQAAAGKLEYFLTRGGEKLEEDIYGTMIQQSKGGPFEGTIEHVSGFSFPDITANTLYGLEVKTSKQSRWRTTGNSVLESTRINGVEGVYLMFGKLSEPIDFRWRKYEDCLYDVAVTHSPRYLVDMETPFGETIFDKMGVQYDEIRSLNNPIQPIVGTIAHSKIEKKCGGWIPATQNLPPRALVSDYCRIYRWKREGDSKMKRWDFSLKSSGKTTANTLDWLLG